MKAGGAWEHAINLLYYPIRPLDRSGHERLRPRAGATVKQIVRGFQVTSHEDSVSLPGNSLPPPASDAVVTGPAGNERASLGQRSSIAFMISSAHRTASAIALMVAGTRFPPSNCASLRALSSKTPAENGFGAASRAVLMDGRASKLPQSGLYYRARWAGGR
jgi:hypothetical protein